MVGKESIRANYLQLIRADGAHSWVREVTKIPMKGEDSGQIWSTIDFVPDTDFPDIRNSTVIHSQIGGCTLTPREERKVRMTVQLEAQPEMYDPAGLGHLDVSKVMWFKAGQKALKPHKMEAEAPPEWWDAYCVYQRVFLIGDAAQTIPPLQDISIFSE